MKASRLKLGQFGNSVNIPPGMEYQAYCIKLTNTEGRHPNTCENVQAELVFTFLHTGRKLKVTGLFAQTDGQSVTLQPVPAVSLNMLESSEILLLCRNSLDRVFCTLSSSPFKPESESRLEFGDWRLEITVSSESGEDSASIAYDVRLKPDLSSTWSPIQSVPAKSPIASTRARHPKAFVSHSSQDHDFVEKLAADLRSNGVEAWYSGWEIKPGDSIRQKIDEGLEGCEFFIIVLSKNSISRPWVQTELDAATIGKLNGNVRKIIPIKIEDFGSLPPILASLCWEDFSTRPYQSAFKRILDSVFEVDVRPPLGKPPGERRSSITPIGVSEVAKKEPVTNFPIDMHVVGDFAVQLREEGFDSRVDVFNGQVGLIVGPRGLDPSRMSPDTAGLFFPLWELNHEGNRTSVASRLFHDIVERRPSDWKFNRPYSNWNRSASRLGDRNLEDSIERELGSRFPTIEYPANIDIVGAQDRTSATIRVTNLEASINETVTTDPEDVLGSGGISAAVMAATERVISSLQRAGRMALRSVEKVNFQLTCPMCSNRSTHSFAAGELTNLLESAKLKLYCVRCDQQWSPSDQETRDLSKWLESHVPGGDASKAPKRRQASQPAIPLTEE